MENNALIRRLTLTGENGGKTVLRHDANGYSVEEATAGNTEAAILALLWEDRRADARPLAAGDEAELCALARALAASV
jgi:hypothetical protein